MAEFGSSTVVLDCQVCGRGLPAIGITIDVTDRTPDALILELQPRVSRSWLAACRLAHPWCFGGRDDLPAEAAA